MGSFVWLFNLERQKGTIPVLHHTVKNVVLYNKKNVWLIIGPEENWFFVTNNLYANSFQGQLHN